MCSPWEGKAHCFQCKRFLWEAALREARRETDNNVKRKRNRANRDTSSIQARVVYAEHCARKGALSKADQAITSTSVPNANPTNIDLLRAKHPEPAHPSRDLMRLSSMSSIELGCSILAVT